MTARCELRTSLRDEENADYTLHSMAQGPTPMLVVEGETDRLFWESCLSVNSSKIYVTGGRTRLAELAEKFIDSSLVFIYDRDFDESIILENSLAYPAADREAYMFDTVGRSFVQAYVAPLSAEKREDVDAEEVFSNLVGSAILIGNVRHANRRVPLEDRIDFEDGKWCHQRLRKVAKLAVVPEEGKRKIIDSLVSQESVLNERINWGATSLYNGKDVLLIMSMFMHEFSAYPKTGNVERSMERAHHLYDRLQDQFVAGSGGFEFIQNVRRKLGFGLEASEAE